MATVKTRHVWVIELKSDYYDNWLPTVGVRLSKSAAIEEKREWMRGNSGIPKQNFRITKYVSAP